jgi:hypothetical protein
MRLQQMISGRIERGGATLVGARSATRSVVQREGAARVYITEARRRSLLAALDADRLW